MARSLVWPARLSNTLVRTRLVVGTTSSKDGLIVNDKPIIAYRLIVGIISIIKVAYILLSEVVASHK